MSSAHHDTPSRTWWSLSSKPPSVPPGTQQYSPSPEKVSRSQSKSSSGLSFTSFASAMGFKSKKQPPSLTIQEPIVRAPVVSSPTDSAHMHTGKYSSRPPSKSVSSTRSRVDSIEPRTPLDAPRDGRQSLLTLSDIDPFAGRGIITVSASHTPSDPNRLSAYSNSSGAEFPTKKGDVPLFNRTSYASSSSNSHNHGGEPSPLSRTASPILPSDVSLPKKLRNKKSAASLHRKKSFVTVDGPWQNDSGKEHVAPRPDSSSRLTDKNRSSQPELSPPPRPPMRARGMTDSGAERRPSLLSGNRPPSRPSSRPSSSHRTSSQKSPPPPPPVSPRVVIRQASMSRIGSPPSAPPTHGLPATPGSPVDDNDSSIHLSGVASASSSSLSFASSASSSRDPVVVEPLHILRQKDKWPSERSLFSSSATEVDRERTSVHRSNPSASQSPPTSPRTLKKALSQSSLGKRGSHQPPSIPSPSPDKVPEKTPRKQRSFHHPRIPIPPIPLPLRHTNSFGAPSTSPSDSGGMSVAEQRRGSASSSSAPGRKRLFSGSSLRRPSTSQCTPVDDDNQSLFSLRSDPDQHLSSSIFKPWASPQAPAPSSFWDEGAAETTPSSPVRSVQQEYTPQHIMSPAEMAKVEASMEVTSPLMRQRGLSILSVSTAASEQEPEWASPTSGLLPPPPSTWSGARQRNAPARTISLTAKSSGPPHPRIGARPSTAQPDLSPSHEQIIFRPSSSPPPTLTSLPPPPRPRQRPTIITEPDRSSTVITPLPPPPRKPSRPKTSIEKTLHRQSLMRKPSFLDIDDETDRDTDVETPYEPPGGGSFLDFARESFDTVRSAD